MRSTGTGCTLIKKNLYGAPLNHIAFPPKRCTVHITRKLFNRGRPSDSFLIAQIAPHNPLACKKWYKKAFRFI